MLTPAQKKLISLISQENLQLEEIQNLLDNNQGILTCNYTTAVLQDIIITDKLPNEKLSVLKLLSDNISAEIYHHRFINIFFGAVSQGNLYTLKKILEIKPDLVNQLYCKINSPLFHAISQGHLTVVEFLLTQVPNLIGLVNEGGLTLLHYAALGENPHDMIELLLNYDHSLANVVADSGNTALRSYVLLHNNLNTVLVDLVVTNQAFNDLVVINDFFENSDLHASFSELVIARNELIARSKLELKNYISNDPIQIIVSYMAPRDTLQELDANAVIIHVESEDDAATVAGNVTFPEYDEADWA